MSSSPETAVVIASLQVQSSFQSVPLGAACLVSALRADPELSRRAAVALGDWSLEDSGLSGLDASGKDVVAAGEIIGKNVAALLAAIAPGAKTRVVGFSTYVWNRPVFEAAARWLRANLPGTIIFAGGPEVTAAPESFSGDFDYAIAGEGEIGAVELVRSIATGSPVPSWTKAGGRPAQPDCATLRSPWLDGALEGTTAFRDYKGALWELARGCPYKCSYCYESKGDKKVRPLPLARLERELDYFVKSGVERVFVLDPTYNASRDRALSILSLIAKRAPEIHFNFEVRAEHLDRETVEAFSRVPCSLQIGLQSSNPEALALVNRSVDLKQFSKKIGLLNDAGVVFGLDLMYGLPGDTLSSFRASIDYACGLYPNNLELFRLAVLPGTALHDDAKRLGLKAMARPPYHVESTAKFPAQDLERAAELARACDAFYTQGRAVTWFLSALHPLHLKPSQFFQDFAAFLLTPEAARILESQGCAARPECELPHRAAEALQLAFLGEKFREKDKAFLLPALTDVVRLNGAWTRALAEGEESAITLSYHPEDLFGPDAMDLEYFTENACMERCEVRVFPSADGPDLEIR